MKHWIGSSLFPRKTVSAVPGESGDDVTVHLHYRNGTKPDMIERFRIDGGRRFFLTFLEGGTVDLNLIHVKDIVFEDLVHFGPGHADTRSHRVRVSLNNGRVLQGYTAGPQCLTGLREGVEWLYSTQGMSQDQTQQGHVSRIVVRDIRHN